MDEKIDYQALAEGLMKDLENARIDNMKAKYELEHIPSRFHMSLEDMKNFIQRNYIVLMFALFALHTLFSMWLDLLTAFPGRKKHE